MLLLMNSTFHFHEKEYAISSFQLVIIFSLFLSGNYTKRPTEHCFTRLPSGFHLFLLRPVGRGQGEVDGVSEGSPQCTFQSQPLGLTSCKSALLQWGCGHHWPGLITPSLSVSFLLNVSLSPHCIPDIPIH